METSKTTSRGGNTRARSGRTPGDTSPLESITASSEGNSMPTGLVGKVRDQATAQLSTQKDRATDGLGSLVQAVRQTTATLRENQQDTVAQYVEQAADQIERFSNRLRERDVRELLDDAQRFARRQPALFIGGSFALGLIAARFLKSSRDGRISDDHIGMSRGYMASTDFDAARTEAP